MDAEVPIYVQEYHSKRQLAVYTSTILPRIGDTIMIYNEKYSRFTVQRVEHQIFHNGLKSIILEVT